MKCEICGKECNGLVGLASHIKWNHTEISNKGYYDKYFKKESEGICLGVNLLGVKCEKETGYLGLRLGYSKHCSSICSSNDKEVQEKHKQTEQDLNFKNPNRPKEIQEKFINTMMKNHRVKYPYQSKEIREKCDHTNFIRCGHKHTMQSEEGKRKYNQTNLEKNIKDPDRISKIVKKREETCLKNNGVKYSYQSEKIRKKGEHTCFNNQGIDNIFKDSEYIKECMIEKYGSDNAMKLQEFVDKAKQTRIKNGTMISDNQLSGFRMYCRRVSHFTNLSLQKKYTKEELEKRKRVEIDSGLHADHRFSIIEGFKQNILPCIIGCQSNLELLLGRDNLKKYTKCSITKEELFQLYEQEINWEDVFNKQKVLKKDK